MPRPDSHTLIGQDKSMVPLSLQRMFKASSTVDSIWIGPQEAKPFSREESEAFELAHGIMKHLCIRAPLEHASGHPGGPLSAFTFAYALLRRRTPGQDCPLRYGAGHLSLLAYGLQYLGGRSGNDPRLESPEAIIKHFRTPAGLPGHVEAGIGDIPFGTGPLGKGLSNASGVALGWKMQRRSGIVDVLESDGSLEEGQSMEAARLASHLQLDHLVLHGDINDIQLSSLPSKTVACDIARIFQSMGWQVIEVQNGNDPGQVIAALDAADVCIGKGRPIFICYYTTMGYGLESMEEAADAGSSQYHGAPMKKEFAEKELAKLPPLSDLVAHYEKYRQKASKSYARAEAGPVPPPPKMKRILTKEKGEIRKEFGSVSMKNLMGADPRIVILHADLGGSGGFDKVEKEFPDRVINCGVAEANMYMMASGLRQAGMLPVTYTFAAFGTNEARANARLIDINAGHTECAVLHDCTHCGVNVGEDGETHQEQNYLNIPYRHTQVWVPVDSNQGAAMAERALQLIAEGRTNVYVFSGRSAHPQLLKSNGEEFYDADYVFEGSADIVRGSGDLTDTLTIFATGAAVHDAVAAADALLGSKQKTHVRVVNVACIRPFDASAVIQAALETTHLVVVEDHNTEGGLASQIADVIADFQLPCSLRRLGLTQFYPSGTAEELKFIAGLDSESIENAVLDELRAEVCGGEDAFVTCISALSGRVRQSRFRDSALRILERVKSEEEYLEKLRDAWRKRACPIEKLPKNEELREKL